MADPQATAVNEEHSRLRRLLNLVELLELGSHRNASQLASALSVSRRTIFRDLQTLLSAGVPIQYDSSRQHYRLQKQGPLNSRHPIPDVMNIALSVREVGDAGFDEVAAFIETEVLHRLSEASRQFFREALEWIVPTPSAGHGVESVHLRTLFTCYRDRRKARVNYRRQDGDVQGTLLAPTQLVTGHQGWEVVGWSTFHRANIGVQVTRIESVTMSEDLFTKPERHILTWLQE